MACVKVVLLNIHIDEKIAFLCDLCPALKTAVLSLVSKEQKVSFERNNVAALPVCFPSYLIISSIDVYSLLFLVNLSSFLFLFSV